MINKDLLMPELIYNKPIRYSNSIVVYPVTMEHILTFNALKQSIIVRKNSTFRDKKIIKMTYLDFLFYCVGNTQLEEEYQIRNLSQYFSYALSLLRLVCKDSKIVINNITGEIFINEELITSQIFDDLRRIIIIQNDIDFDIDEFLNYDTEQRLLKAQKDTYKNKNDADVEDYIDSLVIAMNTTEERIMNMTIRKFWRYIKRYQLHENYTIAKTGESTGFVKYKEPIKHWMISLDEDDKYSHLKANEDEIRSKIG